MKPDLVRLDAPLDYRIIWNHLKARLLGISREEAQRAATAIEEVKIRRAQGGYAMCLRVIEEMNILVDHERNPQSDKSDDDNLH